MPKIRSTVQSNDSQLKENILHGPFPSLTLLAASENAIIIRSSADSVEISTG